jgi:hypothetical protein
LGCAAGLLLVSGARAQTAGFPFQIRIQQGANVATVGNGSNIIIGADNVGQVVVVKVNLSYRGQTSVTFQQPPELLGSTDFQITTSLPPLPFTLTPTQAVAFDLQFRPSTPNRVTAQLELPYTEAPAVGVPSGTPPTRGFVNLSLTGTAPDMTVSYILQSELNVIPLPPGGKLSFPPTLVNTVATALVVINNRGSGPGPVKGIAVTGEAFQAQGLPLFPITLDAGAEFRFNLRYSPKRVETSTGKLQITIGERVLNFDLEGSSINSNFSYEILFEEGPKTILPDESFLMPDTNVGERSSVAVRVRNTGNSEGVVQQPNLIGTGFQLTDPPFFPQTLTPNAALVFTLTFAPQQAGESKGRLRIGNDSFEVVARGIGPRLLYSYTTGAEVNQLSPGGPVIFSPVGVGETSTLNFTVRNSGTAAATIANIGVAEPGSAFTLSGVPGLPARLEPDASLQFSINFKPRAPGFTTANLRIDAVSFTLTGSGTQPPPLPGYRFTGPGGTVEALQQPAIGLELESAFPIAVAGTLTMNVQPDGFSADPAVQFATGGRTAGFTIAANTTAAIFANGSREIRLQTGSVSGAIILTPSFATESGFNLTPESPASMRLAVPPTPPQLLNLQVGSRTQNGVVLAITGVVTTRTLNRLEFRFTPAPNFNVPTTSFTLNIESDASAWFRSTASQAFGGQFLIQVPFTFRSDQTSVTSPLDALQSVSVTASNEQGSSNSLSLDLRQ